MCVFPGKPQGGAGRGVVDSHQVKERTGARQKAQCIVARPRSHGGRVQTVSAF